MLFSTYKSTRVVGNEFLRAPVLKFRAFIEAYCCRSWACGAHVIPTEIRWLISAAIVIQYMSRWNSWRVAQEDVEFTMIKRWGSVEEVRKLSKDDQIRVRSSSCSCSCLDGGG